MYVSRHDLISTLLEAQQVPYELIRAPDAVSLKEDWLEQTVPLRNVSKLAILKDHHGIVIAMYPADHAFSLADLKKTLHRPLETIDSKLAFDNLEKKIRLSGFMLTRTNGIQLIIDELLTNQNTIYFEASTPYSLYRVKAADLEMMVNDALLGSSFSRSTSPAKSTNSTVPRTTIMDKIKHSGQVPELPDQPDRILSLRNDPSSTVDDLTRILDADLLLSGQIIRYSNSEIFGNTQSITSLKDAIFRVLGYETVLHIALGYALARSFRLPENGGPLGQQAFWKHATYSAALAHQLANAMPPRARPAPGLCYLAGLLHDIGFLVLKQFFTNEYVWLNKMIAANPKVPITEIENRLLGCSHTDLGVWLMRAWNMPEELCITVAEHHNPAYQGEYAVYVDLISLTERLLKTHGMSDADTDEIPDDLLERLGLSEEEIYMITDDVLQVGNTLKEMAFAISA
jgi:putative nucleotidyltransferase with HDIG domain